MMITTLTASIAMHQYHAWWQPVQRWLRGALQRPQAQPELAQPAPACIRVRHRAAFAGRSPVAVRPAALTPFVSRTAEAPRRRAFVRCDPSDHRRAVIGGSFAEVCAALERLEAQSH